MGPVGVVVVDVVDDESFDLTLVPDDGPVEELTAQRADPAFREGVRDGGADWALEDHHSFGSEDLVEGLNELTSAVTHQGTGIGELVTVVEEEVSGGLGRPWSGGVGGDAGEEDLAGGDVDEKQQVVAAQQRGVDRGEVTSHRGLGPQKLGPCDRGALWCRIDSVGLEDSPDGGRSNTMAETDKFALDAAISPRWIIGRHLDHKSA